MAEILDAEGNDLRYLPISGLKAGEDSQLVEIQVKCGPGRVLACNADERAQMMGSQAEAGPYVDLAQNPIDLSGLGSGFVTFYIYVHADEDVVADRVPLMAGPVIQSPANRNG